MLNTYLVYMMQRRISPRLGMEYARHLLRYQKLALRTHAGRLGILLIIPRQHLYLQASQVTCMGYYTVQFALGLYFG